jgi:hypothetical protein
MKTQMIALATLALSTGALAQLPLTNGSFEVPDPLNPAQPEGWKTDDPADCYWGVGANGDLVRSGARSVVVGQTGTGAVPAFRSYNTDRFNFFANNGLGAYYDFPFRWNGGTIRCRVFYAIRANEALPPQVRASVKLNIKGAGNTFEENGSIDPWVGPTWQSILISGHTGGQWVPLKIVWPQAQYQAAVIARTVVDPTCSGTQGVDCPPFFTLPTIRFGQCVWPNRLKGVLGRFNQTSGVSGTGKIFWDDFWVGQGGDVAGSGQTEGLDGQLTADDIIVFINWFFASDDRADIAGAGQTAGADGQYTADDIIVFINEFFASDALPPCNP